MSEREPNFDRGFDYESETSPEKEANIGQGEKAPVPPSDDEDTEEKAE